MYSPSQALYEGWARAEDQKKADAMINALRASRDEWQKRATFAEERLLTLEMLVRAASELVANKERVR